MEYTTRKEVVTKLVIEDFPAYLKYGMYHVKVLNEKHIVRAAITHDGAMLDISSYLISLDWEPCTDTEFYETAAEAYRRINEGCDIISLQLEGGAYAD